MNSQQAEAKNWFQVQLRNNYHEYLSNIESLQNVMKAKGIFKLNLENLSKEIEFSSEGTLLIVQERKYLPNREIIVSSNSVNEILTNIFNYKKPVKSLQNVAPQHMINLNKSIKKAYDKTKDFDFYLPDNN